MQNVNVEVDSLFPIRSFSAKVAMLAVLTVAFIVASASCILFVNRHEREQALIAAKEQARILFEQNLALQTNFRDGVRPKILEMYQRFSPDEFDPAFMSSFWIIRKVNSSFNKAGPLTYQYRVFAVNARSPESEANGLEAEIISKFNDNPPLDEYSAVLETNGDAFYIVMRPGKKVDESCMRCHSTPDAAPKELVARYGSERGFNWPLGKIVSANSIQVPLGQAFKAADRLSLQLSLCFTAALLGICLTLAWVGNAFVFRPLSIVRDKAVRIADSRNGGLKEKIPLPSGSELRDLTSSFNTMTCALFREKSLLEERVQDRTAKLQAMTGSLEAELTERRAAEKALQEALANIKTLKELLPICMHCKMIRNDEGYWQQIEGYIHQHSGTQFSHGICPDCLKKHYSQYLGDKADKT